MYICTSQVASLKLRATTRACMEFAKRILGADDLTPVDVQGCNSFTLIVCTVCYVLQGENLSGSLNHRSGTSDVCTAVSFLSLFFVGYSSRITDAWEGSVPF